ncbi:MAG: hypothetical protein GXY36_15335 [Chloroflexi bacterium]|nr:hypothetical protein [Chloroflexota bacterium]
MAIAFIALIAFVGLVTDLALLFVRYASLRRAVDAAAIAAAGQIREGTDYGEVTIAAQQYIELHGMDPNTVLVETCETDIYQWRVGAGEWAGNPHPEGLYPVVNEAMPQTELCNWDDPRKLVRVSAQVNSPTTFLALLGFEEITLETSSVSETAVLDVALVIDTSESMSVETKETHLQAVGLTYPVTGTTPMTVRSSCKLDHDGDPNTPLHNNEAWAGCCNDPGTGRVGDGSVQTNGILVPNGLIWHDTDGNNMYDGPHENGLANNVAQSASFSDPDDYNFTTLVCMPFKDVKDAARLFIKRLDFVRGDRVVFVTFDRHSQPYDPDGEPVFDGGGHVVEENPLRPLIRSEDVAIQTLNEKIGVQVNPTGRFDFCERHEAAKSAYVQYLNDLYAWQFGVSNGTINPSVTPAPQPPELRPVAYETYAACGNTNIGGGIRAANSALTNPSDIRREAVWVMIVLSDGAANVTDPAEGATEGTYGYWGYCPWATFCINKGPGLPKDKYQWPECEALTGTSNPGEPNIPICNDDNPNTRHFCLDWSSQRPGARNPECGPTGSYDADDYARDMADFAGLSEVEDGVPGNFISMFAIAFGDDVINEATGAPLLRYIADAGDNGFIDNNLEQDWRDDKNVNNSDDFGNPDVCEGKAPTEQCGQYYYATDLAALNRVFEDIASKLFTRLSR